FGDAAVGKGDLPEHFHQADAARLIQRAIQHTGEMIEVDGFMLGGRSGFDQLVGCGVIEIEALLEQIMQHLAFGRRYVAVDCGGMNEQRGSRQAVVIVIETAWVLIAAGELGNKILERFEHASYLASTYMWLA